MTFTLRAGVASRPLIPYRPLPLQGHYCLEPYNRVVGELAVRAVVFEQQGTLTAMATLDTLGIDGADTARIRGRIAQATSLAESAVMIACSHTHGAPAVVKLSNDVIDPKWMTQIDD
ncbi:MAG: hypothetical protein IT440_05055, partial [Phycisphaeraceae bacterium]|nr:hypothetical protein [Phycisphaeraceae bacterium]